MRLPGRGSLCKTTTCCRLMRFDAAPAQANASELRNTPLVDEQGLRRPQLLRLLQFLLGHGFLPGLASSLTGRLLSLYAPGAGTSSAMSARQGSVRKPFCTRDFTLSCGSRFPGTSVIRSDIDTSAPGGRFRSRRSALRPCGFSSRCREGFGRPFCAQRGWARKNG